ncbi:hypothetical protein BKA70DRAFT_1193824 [Coprinopsis sp. MPI-PUGE-AT-0042]|nr:hypothetical protein BKA70DRAFT_1193824 [Coprinopsis sp. MPI-PUGE-AT-0042]
MCARAHLFRPMQRSFGRTPMTTYQPTSAEWDAYGTVFATTRFWSRFIAVALWGIQLFMAISGVSTFWKLPKDRRKGHLRLLAFSGVILATNSTNLFIDTWIVFNNLLHSGPEGRRYIEAFYNDLGDAKLSRLSTVATITGYATLSVGDVLLLWRCSIMWSSRRWVVILPSLACAGSIGERKAVQLLTEVLLTNNIAITAESLSVSVNVMVTGLIIYKLWGTWSAISKACPEFKRPRIYSNVTATLVESAAPIAVFGVCYIAVLGINYYQKPELLAQRGRLNALAEVSGCLFYSFSALSPQMIIFRVLNGKSWKNTHESEQITEKLSTSFRFVRPGSSSSDDV